MKKETFERIVKNAKKGEKLVIVTNIIQCHGGYSASHKELNVTKNDVALKDDCIEINMPISKEETNVYNRKLKKYVNIGSITKLLCTKVTLYIDYENIIAVAVLSGEDKAVTEMKM